MELRAIRLLISLAAGILVLPHSVDAQEVIYLVRHSDPPSTLNLDEILDETPLSESGQQRANMLAARLKDAGITAIYATQATRTVETAEPLAQALGLEIRIHSYEDSDGLVRLLRAENGKDRVLVVGHWSTIPEILKDAGISRGSQDRTKCIRQPVRGYPKRGASTGRAAPSLLTTEAESFQSTKRATSREMYPGP